MYIIDVRKSPRRLLINQWLDKRRKRINKCGSPEWLKAIKNNKINYPDLNRRKAENRQLPDRREQLVTESGLSKKNTPVFFTQGEIKLLEDIYLMDLE